MARLIFISPYLKGGQGKAALSRRTNYIATRDGVERIKIDRGEQPAGKKQRTLILRLLEAYPQMMELGEYEDYLRVQTADTAAELIDRALEQFVTAEDQRENYLDYVAHRPGVQKEGDHGLWDRNGKVQNLSKAVEEVANHEGNIWTPVVSLRREDAERLGYTNAENWRALVNACSKEIADGYMSDIFGFSIGNGMLSGNTSGGVTTFSAGTAANAPNISVSAPASGWNLNGSAVNSFTVSSDNDTACAVLVKNADGSYTKLSAANAGSSHSYSTVLSTNDKIVVVVKGDADGSGTVTTTDAMLLVRACLSSTHPAYKAGSNLNKAVYGKISTGVAMEIAKACLSAGHKAYKPIEW